MAVTILGEHITLVRPQRVTRPVIGRVWKRARAFRTRTIKRSMEQLEELARNMGYQLSKERS